MKPCNKIDRDDLEIRYVTGHAKDDGTVTMDKDTPNQTEAITPDRRMLESLVCPLTHAPLTYNAETQELVSKSAKLAFPIRDGIPVMLVDEAREI